MDVEQLREFCLGLKGCTEGFPFDSETLVFKVGGKMFCLVSLEKSPLTFNVKCDPELALDLRERYSGVQPGHHMSKTNWNTVVCDGSFESKKVTEWVKLSYGLVAASLTKKSKAELGL